MGGLKDTKIIMIAVGVMGVIAFFMLLFGQGAGTPVDGDDYYNTPVPMLIEFVKSRDATSENQVKNSSSVREALYGKLVVRFVVIDSEKDAEILREYEQKYGKIETVPYHILTDKDRNVLYEEAGYLTYAELMNIIAKNSGEAEAGARERTS